MKKQLLIAAVAATMASAAMADISISGAAQVNYVTTDFDAAGTADTNAISHDLDLKITGKSGATTVVMDIENLNGGAADTLNVKNVYMSTDIAGINAKIGTWYGSDSLLGNGGQTTDQVSLDTTISGVKIQYEDDMSTSSVTLSGSVAGVAISHEVFNAKTDTKVSGSFGGVNATYRSVNGDAANTDKTSLEVSTEVQGVTVTYANVDADAAGAGTTSDAFFGTFATGSEIKDAKGFGLSTSLAGNTVTFKSYEVDAQDYNKVVVNRALSNGTTFEAIYTDKDGVSTALDLELKVSF
jgi:hypothetical protein